MGVKGEPCSGSDVDDERHRLKSAKPFGWGKCSIGGNGYPWRQVLSR
jgi:hypothetical protein